MLWFKGSGPPPSLLEDLFTGEISDAGHKDYTDIAIIFIK